MKEFQVLFKEFEQFKDKKQNKLQKKYYLV